MNGDLSLSQALGGLRIANPDDAVQASLTAKHEPDGSRSAQPSITSVANDDRTNDASPEASHTQALITTPASQPQSMQQSEPDPSQPSTQPQQPVPAEPSLVPNHSVSYPSRQPSYRNVTRSYGSVRQAAGPPPRGSSKGMAGGHTNSAQPQGPPPTSSEEWKDRGAAVGVRREVDANGRTVVRQVKKGVRDFTFGSVLGEGSYSSVYHATDRQTSKNYAVKVLEKRHIIKEKKIKYVNIEKNTLNRLTEHPGIVRLYYTFQDETSLYYVLDLCNGGELLGVLKKTGTFDVECTRFYGAQILDAIDYMHSRGVIHRDLKPENVLLDDQMHVKITDFGTAKLLKDPREASRDDSADKSMPDPGKQDEEDDERAASFVGTAEYVSPELLTQKSACKASDLWAYGCMVYQLLAGRPPFKAGSEYLTFQKIVNLEFEFPPGFPPAAKDLVERCLVLDPARRVTVEHIKNHEFFDGQQFGKQLWRMKAPRLRPYVPPPQEPTVIQLNGYAGAAAPAPILTSRSAQSPHHNASNGANRPARIITELPPPTQLDIEWSPVLTKNNERILKLGDLMVISAPLPNSPYGKGEEGHKKLSRFFGGSTTKKRQRLVMVTSSGRIVLAPAGGEEKRTKQELSLVASDCTWKSQQDAKGHFVWCVDVGGNHYTFEEPKGANSTDMGRASSAEWIESLERARDMALSQNMASSYSNDVGFGDMSSSSPSTTIDGRGNPHYDSYGAVERTGRNHLSKSQASLEDPTVAPKRNRFSKRQSRNGLDSAF